MLRIALQRDEASGRFRLRSLGKTPTSILCAMYDNDKSLFDVKLSGAAPTGGAGDLRPILAHKAILAHASPHLFDLFTVQGFVDSNKSAYTISNVDHNSLSCIVRYIYTENLDENVEENGAAERVRGILIGAKYLIMKDLAGACEVFLASSGQIGVENCIDVFQFAFRYNCSNLLSAVCAFIAKSLLALSQSAKFLSLKQDECAKFLLSEPVATANADDRCRAAIAWLNHQSPSRAASAECIMSMAALDAAGVKPETLLLAAQSVVIRPTIKGFVLTLVDALASNVRRMSQVESEQKKQTLEEARGEAWYIVGNQVKDRRGFYRYDVVRRQWSTLPNLPWDREHAGVCAVGKRLIVMGGIKRGRRVASIDEYDTTTQIWSTSKTKLCGAKEHVIAAAYGGYAYAFGGCDSSNADRSYKHTERYREGSDSRRQMTRLADMDKERFEAAAACKSEMVFVVGGRTKREDGVQFDLVTIDKYHCTMDKWTLVTDLEEARVGSGVAFVGEDLYIAGGYKSKQVEIFNAETGQMRRCAAQLSVFREGCSAVKLDEHVVCVVGGRQGRGCGAHSSVEVYDTREGKWSTGVIVPNMPNGCANFGFAHVRP